MAYITVCHDCVRRTQARHKANEQLDPVSHWWAAGVPMFRMFSSMWSDLAKSKLQVSAGMYQRMCDLGG